MATFLSPKPPDPLDYNVYLGLWTNWSRGPVFGATLTLGRREGTLLISFTAFFITIVASRFWRIMCSILHRKFSVVEHRDALHYQRQAIFRNSSSSGSGLWSLIQISWTWRKIAQNNLSRTLPPIIFSIICLLAFALASGFSSSISTAIGDEVLINGINCGYIDIAKFAQGDKLTSKAPWETSLVSNAANYAQQMYSPDKTGVFGSTAFVRKTLDTSYNPQGSCPFEDLCRSNTSNLVLDSGYISISDHLGVNLPPVENILFRTVLHCAPLNTEDRSEPTQNHGRSNYTGYYYGPAIAGRKNEILTNYTLAVRDTYSQYVSSSSTGIPSGYGIVVVRAVIVNGGFYTGDFLPDKSLLRGNADLDLFFLLGNRVYTSSPVYDPWYRSYIPVQDAVVHLDPNADGLDDAVKFQTLYRPAEAASPLGCMLQYQICQGPSAKVNSCSALASYSDATVGAASLFGADLSNFTSLEQAIDAYSSNDRASRYFWLLQILNNYPTVISNVVLKMSSQSLASWRTLQGLLQSPLPEDQWKTDVSNWWNISLSLLQASVVDTANGVSNPNLIKFQTNATNAGQRSFCQNQKIRSTSYISFSVFGLYIIYITGGLIILVSWVLDPILLCAQKRWKNREYENLEWACNETLQLQRLAYEESGQGDWSGCINSVPVTAADQELAPLNLLDPEHPRLRHPRSPRSSKEFQNPVTLTGVCSLETLVSQRDEASQEDEACVSPLEPA